MCCDETTKILYSNTVTSSRHHNRLNILFTGALQMGIEREKKLSTCKISQLETCVKRCTDHVCYVKNRKNGKIHE
jgi:hypothetical protein